LITSGPTQEALDEVRYFSNRSSGKMGSALARAALLMGAQVTVVSGPVQVAYPRDAKVIRVRDAVQMLAATVAEANNADIVIGAAAVADYRPSEPVQGKIRRGSGNLTITLVPNPDIIAEVARTYPNALVVGFAAEPTSDLSVAREKLTRKGVFAIAANDVSQSGIGFDAEDNELTLVMLRGDPISSGKKSKLECALWLFENLVKVW
jgi:phosphopantothenoylcysteine decarboxylase/phosphopantothenate--cysteine ligase